jgi:hypothetical protein
MFIVGVPLVVPTVLVCASAAGAAASEAAAAARAVRVRRRIWVSRSGRTSFVVSNTVPGAGLRAQGPKG